MHIEQILKAVGYRFAPGSAYMWACYGDHAHYLDFKTVGGTPVGSVIYDSETAEIFEVTVEVPHRDLAYRWMGTIARKDHEAESKSRNIDPNVAWDDVDYIDIDVDADFLEKLGAIINEEEFDERIVVPVQLSDEEELELYRLAHKADMTVNDYVCMILRQEMETVKTGTYKERYGW